MNRPSKMHPLMRVFILLVFFSAAITGGWRFIGKNTRAASTGTTSLLTIQGSGAGTADGDYVSDASGLDTSHHYFIEVPPGLSRLKVDIFDADIGMGGTAEAGAGRDRDRNGFNSSVSYKLINPAGQPQNTQFDTGNSTGPINSDNAWLTFFDSTGETVRDNFTTAAYTNNDGLANWSTNWIETNDDGIATTGLILITGGELRIEDNGNASSSTIERGANLGNADFANPTLSFDFRTANVEPGDQVLVQVSSNGGTSWSTLETFTGAFAQTSRSYNISSFATANTRIRFITSGVGYSGTDAFFVDNVQIKGGNILSGHWEVRVDMSSSVTTGDDINAFGLRANDGDATSGGAELNIYADSTFDIGVNPPASGTASRSYTAYPYISSGCSCSKNDFDFDSDQGNTGSVSLASRSGNFTQNYSSTSLSTNNSWRRDSFSGWTSDFLSGDYGIWTMNSTINSYVVAGTPNGNLATLYLGNYQTAANPPTANPISNSFRIYLPNDAGSAPVKPYLDQLLVGPGTVIPVGQSADVIIWLRVINPTSRAITFSSSNLVTANVPGSGTVYAGNASVTQGVVVSQPAVGGTGNITWNPGTVAAGNTAIISYFVKVTPTSAGQRVPVTGTPASGNGTRAQFVDETGNTAQTRATYVFGPLCELAVTQGLLSPITSNPGFCSISPSSLPNGRVGVPYSQTISPSGAILALGGLPPGLTLGSGSISGTPTTAGTSNFSVESSNLGFLCAASASYTINITSCSSAITVGNSNESGAGSLRQALVDVCDGGTVTFNTSTVTSPITLSTELDLTRNVTIQGPGAGLLTVSGNNSTRVLNVGSGVTATISGLTIANGHPATNVGGGVFNVGTLTIDSCIIDHNLSLSSGTGAGVYNNGTLTLTNSTVSNNAAQLGGGLDNDGTATVTGTTFNNNSAATGSGGGINNTHSLLMTNCTISGNIALSGGGLSQTSASGSTNLLNCTIYNNQANSIGGIQKTAGTLTLNNTIVAGNFLTVLSGNPNPSDISGTVVSSSAFNLIGTGGSGGLVNGSNGNQVGVANAFLAPLGNYGGKTQTHALSSISPAIAAGNVFGNPPTDQRGVARPTEQAVDIGSFQSNITVLPSSYQVGSAGSLYPTQNFSASGGANPYTFSISGTLPTGISFNASTASLSGTPTQTGAFPICVIATDTGGFGGVSCNTLTINVGPLDHFAIANIAGPQTAGAPFNISITAQDAANNAVSSFTGTVSLTTNSGTVAPLTSGAFNGGVLTQSVSVSQAGAGRTITVNDGSGHTGTSNGFAVNAGALHHFAIGNVTTQTAGTAFNISLTAQDSNNNAVTGFNGTVGLATSAGSMSPTTSGNFTGGLLTQSVTLALSGSGRTISVNDGSGHAGTSNGFTVGCPSIVISPSSLPAVAVGSNYNHPVLGSGGTGTYSFAITNGTAPTGLTLNSDGTWTGALTATGTFSFTITATDAVSGCTGSQSYSIFVGSSVTNGNVLISEFRFRGPGGANDEFIEFYNNTDADIAVASTDGSAGWALVAADGQVRFIVPNGTVLPARGHFLAVNTLGYSLSGYPAGYAGPTATTATGDTVLKPDGVTSAAGYDIDIPDGSGIALFKTASPAGFVLNNRLDAVGYAGVDALYREGVGFATGGAETTQNIEYSFVRNLVSGIPQDTNINTADFLSVDTLGTQTGLGRLMGAPGPENSTSPLNRTNWSMVTPGLIDPCTVSTAAPNRVRDTSNFNDILGGSGSYSLGTLSIRRSYTNTTSAMSVTRLRFRIIDITGFPETAGVADLRVVSSGNTIVPTTVCGGSNLAIMGTTLEQVPTQSMGGGVNSTLSAGTITLATPLAPGQTIDLQFLLGVKQGGSFRFFITVEALP